MAPIVGRSGSLRSGHNGAIAQLGERVVRNDEVGGSIPPGSTSLRLLRKLRLPPPPFAAPPSTRRGTPPGALWEKGRGGLPRRAPKGEAGPLDPPFNPLPL